MPLRNTIIPNINIPAIRGWCLKYVDDGINAPARKATAQLSFNQEQKNGNITFDLPVGVWLAGYLRLDKGAYAGLGHVFWAFKHADGRMEIHDSEVHGGGRSKPYGSIAELLAWFGGHAPVFIGYTHGIDGKHLVESYELPKPPAPAPAPTPAPAPSVPTHTVQEGETLGQIILDRGWGTDAGLWGDNGDVARVANANGIADANLIHPGQVIKKA